MSFYSFSSSFSASSSSSSQSSFPFSFSNTSSPSFSLGSSPSPFGPSLPATGFFGSSSSSSYPSAASSVPSVPFGFSSVASGTSSPSPSLFGSSSSAAAAASSPFGASSGPSISGASVFGSSAPFLFESSVVSSCTAPAFVVSTSASAAPATSISSTTVGQTSSTLVVASTIGTTSTVGTSVTTAPKLPSEITGKTMEEEPHEQAPPNDSVQIVPREPFCNKEPLNTEVLPILPLTSQGGSTDNVDLVTHMKIPLPTSHVVNEQVIISSENQSLPYPVSLKGEEAASAIESPEGDVLSNHVKTSSPYMGTFNIKDATNASKLIEGVIPDLDENRKALIIKIFIKYPSMMNMHPDWRSSYIKYMFMSLGDLLVLMSSITPMTLDEATRREIELMIIELERNNCDEVFISDMKALISKAWDSHLSLGKHHEELRILKKECEDLQARIRVLEDLLEQEKTPIFP